MFCPNCGHSHDDNDKFCAYCGTKFDEPAQKKEDGRVFEEVEPNANHTFNQAPPQPNQQYIYVNNQQSEKNGMAITGFVLSFIVPILGLIFGIIGLNRANALPNKNGRGMAIAAIIIASVSMVLDVIVELFMMLYEIPALYALL